MNHSTPSVAVVVPMSNRAELTPDEEISLRHLRHYLGRYDRYMVVPEHLDVDFPDFQLARFDDSYFGSAAANTRLMLSTGFYERFRAYQYILIYHLDALVFSDQLEAWCQKGFDYIGPPWLITEDTPWVKEPGVGNGGFSLRKVESCLKVLNSSQYAMTPREYWRRTVAVQPFLGRLLRLPYRYVKHIKRFNNIQRELARYKRNEDLFWGWRATHYWADFKIASVETALRFAFESMPRTCFERLDCQLPFGCHAWPKYDRAFWETYLLQAP